MYTCRNAKATSGTELERGEIEVELKSRGKKVSALQRLGEKRGKKVSELQKLGERSGKKVSELQKLGERLPESCKLHPALEVYVTDEHDPLQRVGLVGELGVRVRAPLFHAGWLF